MNVKIVRSKHRKWVHFPKNHSFLPASIKKICTCWNIPSPLLNTTLLYHECMNFSTVFLFCLKAAEPAALINGQDERASPVVDKCVRLCLCGRQESESNECFRLHIVCFLYLLVSFYTTTGNPGTIWAPKRQKLLLF